MLLETNVDHKVNQASAEFIPGFLKYSFLRVFQALDFPERRHGPDGLSRVKSHIVAIRLKLLVQFGLHLLDQDKDGPYSYNMYNYARGNPVNYVDPSGNYIESMIDIVSIGAGIHSISQWNSQTPWTTQTVDVAGVTVDIICLALPVVTIGTSLWIKGAREATEQVAKNADEVGEAALRQVEVSGGGPRLPRSLGAAGNITTRSRIADSPFAVRKAEDLGAQAQRDVDHLLAALRAGNQNPGIGTRALGEGFFELRGANAGRVIIKEISSGTYDIVGKFQGHVRGGLANSATIQRLIGDYNAL